jgi:hypothetical protein
MTLAVLFRLIVYSIEQGKLLTCFVVVPILCTLGYMSRSGCSVVLGRPEWLDVPRFYCTGQRRVSIESDLMAF